MTEPSRCRLHGGLVNITELTDEHVPPKAIMPFLKLARQSASNKYLDAKSRKRPKFEQNGIKFKRSLCRKCNNEILGLHYDPVLVAFSHQVEQSVTQGNIVLPFDAFSLLVKPLPLMKAILGHLMAASSVVTDTWLDTLSRDCVLNEDAPIPDEIHIFYWHYPYPNEVHVRRDFFMRSQDPFDGSSGEVFATIKVFPVAYLVTKARSFEGLFELTKWRSVGKSEEVHLPVRFEAQAKTSSYPDGERLIIVGSPEDSSVSATKLAP